MLEATEEVQVLGLRIFPKFGKRVDVAFINRAVLFSQKCYVSLDPCNPLFDITFNPRNISKLITKARPNGQLTAVKTRAIEGIETRLK